MRNEYQSMTKHLSLLDEVFTVQTGHSLRSMFVAQAVGASGRQQAWLMRKTTGLLHLTHTISLLVRP